MSTASTTASSRLGSAERPATPPGGAPGPRALGGRPWTTEPLAAVLDGTASEEVRRALLSGEPDRKGLRPTAFALLRAAIDAEATRQAVAELSQPTAQEETQLDRVTALLEAVAESQVRIEQRLAAIESRLGVQAGASRRG